MSRLHVWSVLALVAVVGTAWASDGVDLTKNASVGPTIAGAPTADLAGLIRSNGLLNPSRLKTWSSYSFGMSSGPGGMSSAGLFTEHIQYEIAKPLLLNMEVGLLHNPLGTIGVHSIGGPQQASLVIPSADLIYRPNKNMVISLHYSQMPYSAYQTGVGYYPWWQNPQAGW